MWRHRPALSRALILATTLFALPLAVGAARAQAGRVKPLPRYTVRVAHPRARVGKRVLLKAHAAPATSGTGLRYAWTLDGRRLADCAGRRCAFRARRSGAHRIALVVDDGDRRAAAHKRLRVAKSPRRGRR
jgi:hypothetical protein